MNDAINKEIKNFFEVKNRSRKFIPGETKIPLASPSYGYEEVVDALDSMLSTWVTMGEKVKIFEEKFCEYIGSENAIMVNSGSSANLLAVFAAGNPLKRNPLKILVTMALVFGKVSSPFYDVPAESR